MTTQYAEEQGFKKKYLAPLIVLMLCAVSLTGAAYAYSTSVTGHGDIDYDYYSIDMYKDDGTTVISENLKANGDFDVQTTKTVGSTYHASVDKATVTFTTKIKVTSDAPNTEKCVISGAAKYVKQDGTVDFYKSWADDATKPTCTVKICTENTTTEVTETYVNTVYTAIITVTLPAIAEQDLGVKTPGEIDNAVKFNGIGCIEITVTAKNVSA